MVSATAFERKGRTRLNDRAPAAPRRSHVALERQWVRERRDPHRAIHQTLLTDINNYLELLTAPYIRTTISTSQQSAERRFSNYRMIEIIFDKSVENFIQSLEKPTIAKVLRVIDLLEKFGHRLGLPHSKKVTTGLFELRIRGQQEVRLFYTFQKGTIIILHGYIKKSPTIPRGEIKQAGRKLKALT